jgi:phage shock protein A
VLIDVKAIVPGTPTAARIADANDKVLAAFAAAEHARLACNASGYAAAMQQANAAIADIRSALPKRQ